MNTIGNAIRTFFHGFNLRQLIIILGLCVLLVFILKWQTISDYFEKRLEKQKSELLQRQKIEASEKIISSLKKVKVFPELAYIPNLKISNATISTMWKDQKMYYKLKLYSDTTNLKNGEFEKKIEMVENFTINFLNKDGFQMFNLEINSSDLIQVIDNNGNVIGYMSNNNVLIPADNYQELEKCQLVYVMK